MRGAMKAAILNWKYFKYLFWLSPGLISAGLIAGLVTGIWDAVSLGLVFAGVAIAIAALIYYSNALPGFGRAIDSSKHQCP
ncbi:hypothetical protein HC928_11345 [bacterium]|nr:hypothetical protein [bacterium]